MPEVKREQAIQTSIRHAVMTGFAHVVYEGHEDPPRGDILLPYADEERRRKFTAAVQTALPLVEAGSAAVARAAASINIIAITSLPLPVARRAAGLFGRLEDSQDEGGKQLKHFIRRELLLDQTGLDWQALGVIHRVYEKEWRATYQGGNPEKRQLAKRNLLWLIAALIAHYDPASEFAARALPVLVSMALALLDALEKMRLDDQLRNAALGLQAQPFPFGNCKFAQGFFPREAIEFLNTHIYPAVEEKWLAIHQRPDGAPRPAPPPGKPPLFLYEEKQGAQVLAWQAVKSSMGRKCIYLTDELAGRLADNALALAELLIEEVGARIDEERPFMSLDDEARYGGKLRQDLYQAYVATHPHAAMAFRLEDLFNYELQPDAAC